LLADALDPGFIDAHVRALRDRVAEAGVDEVAAATSSEHGVAEADAGRAAALVMRALADAEPVPAPRAEPGGAVEPYIPRDAVESLIQTVVEQRLREAPEARLIDPGELAADDPRAAIGGATAAVRDTTQFGPQDGRWVGEILKAVVARIARGTHPFNPKPAEHQVDDRARLLVVGDWGTGNAGARRVSAAMVEAIEETLSEGRQVHVIHLGDVYYSGDAGEYRDRVLAPGRWPVTEELNGRGVTSWSLNGNHDMYSGGWAYFEKLLGDGRFALQRAPDDRPTSWFRLFTPGGWDVVGLDTSWSSDPLYAGHQGLLEEPQGATVAGWAGEEDRRLLLLSHHQFVSSYRKPDESKVLKEAIAGALDGGRVAGWIWGHEHVCMTFKPAPNLPFSCCVGHGGVPVPPKPGGPIPDPGEWVDREVDPGSGGTWARQGFAILDLHGDRITVGFRNDAGDAVGDPREIG